MDTHRHPGWRNFASLTMRLGRFGNIYFGRKPPTHTIQDVEGYYVSLQNDDKTSLSSYLNLRRRFTSR